MRDFLDLDDLDDEAVQDLLALAAELEREGPSDRLRGKVLALVFLNPSLRTRASFQSGMAQLGGSSFLIEPGQGSWRLELEQGAVMAGAAAEHVREFVPVLEEYADALAVRCFAEGRDLARDLRDPVLAAFREAARGPLINMESAVGHPCQALADWKTLDDCEIPRRGGRLVLTWAWHPRPLPLAVPSSVLRMATRRGMDVTLLHPEGFELPEELLEPARAAATATGGSLRETVDREEALAGAHVVYAKSWGSPLAYGDPHREGTLRQGLRSWCVHEEWFAAARPDSIFMHCLPVRRNVVVSDGVLDGPRSRVVRQAGNRLHAQKAVLVRLLEGRCRGR